VSAEVLVEQFERVTQAPRALPELRRLVHRLAVRGSLVGQEHSNHSARALVAQLQAARDASLAPGTRTKEPIQPLDASEILVPFAVPPTWTWLRLVDVGPLSGGMTPSKSRSEFWDGDIPWFSPKDMKADEVRDSGLKITTVGVSETGLQIYPPGCLFIVARSGILKRTLPVAINRVPATVNQDMKVLRPFVGGLERYLQIMFKGLTDFVLSELVKTGTTVQSLKYEEFERQPIPIPPLAEQHRIVAKVDELMALCDELEAAQTEREARRERLRTTSLRSLVAPEEPKENARFFLRHSARMITGPKHVAGLREAIYKLAVTGRLVSQDPEEEEAAVLLARVQAEKHRVENGATGRDWLSTVTSDVEATFPPRAGWTWSRIGAAVERVTVGYVGPMTSHYVAGGIPFLRSQNVRANRFRPEGLIAISPEFHERIKKSALAPGDVVVVRSGNVGVSCVIPDHLVDANCSDLVVIKRPMALVPAFLALYLNSSASVHIEAGAVGVALTHFNTKSVATMPIPLPPLAEQQRIVAKVDELMAVCDELGQSLATEQTERARLLEALLHDALEDALPARELELLGAR
jgi:type I restriction enzyme S subunit